MANALKATGKRDELKSPLNIREHYDEFRKLLFKRQTEILSRSDLERAQIDEQVMTAPGDVGDQSVVDLSADYYLKLADNHREEVVQIREALDRIGRGAYGACESCGDDIAIERLRNLPYAKLCIDCKSADEMGKNVVRGPTTLKL